jgi:hypothetical protein
MRYTEKVYSSSLFACASLRKIPFYLEGQAAGLCCRLYLFYTISLVRRSFSRSAFRSAVQPFVQPDFRPLSFSRISESGCFEYQDFQIRLYESLRTIIGL